MLRESKKKSPVLDKKTINSTHSLIYYISLILFLLVVVFLLFTALPGDPVRLVLGVNATEQAVLALRHELGLDLPLHRQFFRYLKQLLSLDLGISLVTRRPVTGEILRAFAATAGYVFTALGGSAVASLLFFRLFYRHQKLQNVLYRLCSFLTGIPALVLAVALGIFALKLDALAFIPSLHARKFWLAVFVLSLYPACSLYQILVSEGRTVHKKAFISAAKSYGFAGQTVFFRFLLPNVLLPWLAQLSNILASLLAGSVFIELVFSLPGAGRLVAQSVLRHDYPMMQGIVLMSSVGFIILNFGFERLYRFCRRP